MIELLVSDNGIGIPKELYEKAKERFFRIDTSRNTSGHGLGLSLIVAVADLHQGELSFSDNAPGLRAKLALKL
jgi:signal transduction histidine kinase